MRQYSATVSATETTGSSQQPPQGASSTGSTLESLIGEEAAKIALKWVRAQLELDQRAGPSGERDDHFLWQPIYDTMPFPGELEYRMADLAVSAALAAIKERLK